MSVLNEQKVVSIWNDYYYDIHLVDKDGKYVDQFCMGVAGDQKHHADLLVNAVNYHDRLREALERLVRSCDNLEYEAGRVALPTSDAEDLLAELDNLEKQQ